MKYIYLIEHQKISIPLFELSYLHKNEGPAVIDYELKVRDQRDLRSDDTIKYLYAKFRGRFDHVAKPIELFKMLLANGHHLRVQGNDRLFKDYFSVTYEGERDERKIEIGAYYATSVSGPIEQFRSFAECFDELCGCPDMCRDLCHQLISSGYSISARHAGRTLVLVQVTDLGDILSGEELVLQYLVEDGARMSNSDK